MGISWFWVRPSAGGYIHFSAAKHAFQPVDSFRQVAPGGGQIHPETAVSFLPELQTIIQAEPRFMDQFPAQLVMGKRICSEIQPRQIGSLHIAHPNQRKALLKLCSQIISVFANVGHHRRCV